MARLKKTRYIQIVIFAKSNIRYDLTVENSIMSKSVKTSHDPPYIKKQ